MAKTAWARRLLGVLVLMATMVSLTNTAGADNGTLVFSIGDSIFNYSDAGFWGTEFPAAIAPAGQTSLGVDANSGRSITESGTLPSLGSGMDAVAANAATIAAADIVITNLGINDSEAGAAWRGLAREYATAIKAKNPSVILVWITPVAEPGVASSIVVDRGVDHATSVRALHREGIIDIVVEWDTYAMANRNVFHTDGVHYWFTGDAAAYARVAASAIASLSGTTPPTTPTTTTTTPTTTTTAPPPPPLPPSVLAPTEAEIHRLYNAVFGRSSDADGLGYWAQHRRQGLSIFEVADHFTYSVEWTNRYGDTFTDAEVIDALYRNVLSRAGDQGGRSYWAEMLQRGLHRSELIVYFSNSDENVQLAGTTK